MKSKEKKLSRGERKIEKFKAKGYAVVDETKDFAVFNAPKRFNITAFVLLLFCGLFPGIIYLVYYASRKPLQEYMIRK